MLSHTHTYTHAHTHTHAHTTHTNTHTHAHVHTHAHTTHTNIHTPLIHTGTGEGDVGGGRWETSVVFVPKHLVTER